MMSAIQCATALVCRFSNVSDAQSGLLGLNATAEAGGRKAQTISIIPFLSPVNSIPFPSEIDVRNRANMSRIGCLPDL